MVYVVWENFREWLRPDCDSTLMQSGETRPFTSRQMTARAGSALGKFYSCYYTGRGMHRILIFLDTGYLMGPDARYPAIFFSL